MNANAQAFSFNGSVQRTTTTPATGNFCAIQCITDCVFSELVGLNLSGDSLEGEEIPGGMVLYGKYTSFTLVSGTAIGHHSA